jgi:hypothetical protein
MGSIHLCTYLSVYFSIYLFNYLPVHLSIHISPSTTFFSYICSFVYLFNMFIFLSIHPIYRWWRCKRSTCPHRILLPHIVYANCYEPKELSIWKHLEFWWFELYFLWKLTFKNGGSIQECNTIWFLLSLSLASNTYIV